MMTHDCAVEPEMELETKMTMETFEEVVNAPATTEELSANNLAERVINHPHRKLILKRILNQFFTEMPQQTEDTINEAVAHHGSFDMVQSVLLDAKIKDC